MLTVNAPPTVPVGRVKSLGALGPKYQIGRPLHMLADGDWMVEITLLESGERTPYRLSRLLMDPEGL